MKSFRARVCNGDPLLATVLYFLLVLFQTDRLTLVATRYCWYRIYFSRGQAAAQRNGGNLHITDSVKLAGGQHMVCQCFNIETCIRKACYVGIEATPRHAIVVAYAGGSSDVPDLVILNVIDCGIRSRGTLAPCRRSAGARAERNPAINDARGKSGGGGSLRSRLLVVFLVLAFDADVCLFCFVLAIPAEKPILGNASVLVSSPKSGFPPDSGLFRGGGR